LRNFAKTAFNKITIFDASTYIVFDASFNFVYASSWIYKFNMNVYEYTKIIRVTGLHTKI